MECRTLAIAIARRIAEEAWLLAQFSNQMKPDILGMARCRMKVPAPFPTPEFPLMSSKIPLMDFLNRSIESY